MNIVDALTITLGLDASSFTRGRKEATEAFAKTKEEASAFSKSVESSGKKAADSIEGVARQALELFGILAGARSLTDFAAHLTTADAALGRLAANLGIAPDAFSAMTQAVERNGGSAEAAAGSFRALSDSFEQLKRTGASPILSDLYRLQGAGGAAIDMKHGFAGALPGIVANLATIKRLQGQVAADAYARSVGLDSGTANWLEQGQKRVDADTAESRRIGVPNGGQIKAAQDLQRAWITLQQTATALGRRILDDLAPALTQIITAFTDLIQKNPDLVAGIAAFLALFAAAKMAAIVGSIFRFSTALAALGTEGVVALSPLSLLLAGIVASLAVLGGDAAKGIFDKGFNAVTPGANTPEMLENQNMSAWGRMKKIYHHWFGGGGSGNDALRQRAGGRDLNLGAPGKLSANQQEAYRAARGEGLSETAARALVANMSGEGLPKDAHRVHWDGTHFAHGVVQWDDVRSAAIKRQFGKAPEEMSVADQTRAAIWEINSNPRFAKTKSALAGGNAGAMIGALVGNYEAPRNVGGAIAERSRIYQGLGNLKDSAVAVAPAAPAAHAPPNAYGDLSGHPMNQFHSSTPVMPGTVTAAVLHAALRKLPGEQFRRIAQVTHVASSHLHHTVGGNTNTNSVNVGAVHVTVPNGDGDKIAKSIGPALKRHSLSINANYGPI